MNKKGALTDLMIMIFSWFSVAIIVGLAFYLLSAFVPALHSVTDSLPDANGRINQSLNQMTSDINQAYSNLNWLAMVDVGAMILVFFISNAFIKGNPVVLFLYVCAIGIAVWFSVYVANSYETLLTNTILANGLANIPNLSLFMLKLPIFTTIVGFIGAILLYIRIDFGDGY